MLEKARALAGMLLLEERLEQLQARELEGEKRINGERMVKEFTFRGKTLSELSDLSIEEFAKLIPSRRRRSLLRQKNKVLMKKIEKSIQEKKLGKIPKPVKTHKRDAIVIPKMLGLKMSVHNGREFITFEVLPEMLGHTLGEFSLTRKRLMHGKAGIGATKSSTAITARK